MEGTSAPPQPTFQLILRYLDDRGSSMEVVRRGRRREERGYELALFVRLEVLACFDGGAAGVRRRDPLQPIGQPAEPPAREIGDELAEAAGRIKAGMWIRRRVHHPPPPRQRLHPVPHATDPPPPRLHRP